MDVEPLAALDADEEEHGETRVLTDRGWEEAAYIDPGDHWLLLEDGSWASPDGRIRSWPGYAPEVEGPPD